MHSSLQEVRGNCLTSAMLAADWGEAERQCAFLIKWYKRVYCPGHPMTGLQLFTLGNLLFERAKTGEGRSFDMAVAVLNHSFNILVATHGAEHPLVQSLVEMQADASEQQERQNNR